jgi:phosphoglycolate phosphatase
MPLVHAGGRSFDVDAVAFDKDGTLIDLDATWAPLAAAWVRGIAGGDAAMATAIASHLGLDLDGPRLVTDSIFSAGTLGQIRDETAAVLASHGFDDERIETSILAGAEAAMSVGPVDPVPLADLPDLFGRLVAAGIGCAVVTADDRASAATIVTGLGLDTLVATIVGGDETERPKPFADPLLLAAERLGVAPHRILMVGDSLTDQGAARAAGSPFVAVGAGTAAAAGCDAVVHHVGEIRTAAP